MTEGDGSHTLSQVEEGRGTPVGGLKRFRCGDVVPGCTLVCEGTEADIFAQVREHASRDHGIAQVDDAILARVRLALRPL